MLVQFAHKSGRIEHRSSMQPSPAREITTILADLRAGTPDAGTQLADLVYDELHRIAVRQMRKEQRDHTLQPTALVNEAYLQIVHHSDRTWQNRAHFFAVAAKIMRQILVDHARRNAAQKRGGGGARAELSDNLVTVKGRSTDLLALDAALERLAKLDPEQSQVIELQFFAGLTQEEISEVTGMSVRTVKRQWRFARAWLLAELGG